MNTPSQPICTENIRRNCCFEFYFDLRFKLHLRTVVSLLTVFALILIGNGNSVNTLAQSQTPEKPAATPATTPTTAGQKPAKPSLTTGTIKGRLVSGDGQPLTNPNVMAQALNATPTVRPTRVDSEGRFTFDDLPAASYVIIATAPGYIDQSKSLGNVSQWTRHLIGSNVEITLTRGGVITGMVTNAKGEPMVEVPVHATLLNTQPSFGNVFTGNISETDDRGIYRIYGLLPGQYTVYAGGHGQFGQFMPSGFDIDAPTYYPSSTRDAAIPITVRGGDETSGIDIKYKNMEGHAISGVVLGKVETGALGGAIPIFLGPAGLPSVLSIGLAAVTDPRRAFSFSGIADGEYDLFASYQTGPTDVAIVGTKRVTIRGGDVTGVELNLTPLASITGTITLDPIKPEDRCDKRRSELIEIVPVASRDEPKKSGSPALLGMFTMFSAGFGTLNEKGEFALRSLEAAKYRLEIKLPTESWYLRAIKLPGAAARAQQPPTAQPTADPNLDVWQGVVTIKSGERLSGVSVMVGQDAAVLYGRLAAEGAVIRAGTRVHLVPVEREQANIVLRYSETLVQSDGSFALTNIAPGRYFILSRAEAPTEGDALRRPSAWNSPARVKLRGEAEAANMIVELKPCQRLVDYSLKLATAQ